MAAPVLNGKHHRAFMQFVRAGAPRQQGDATLVRYTIGGRYVRYSVRVAKHSTASKPAGSPGL